MRKKKKEKKMVEKTESKTEKKEPKTVEEFLASLTPEKRALVEAKIKGNY